MPVIKVNKILKDHVYNFQQDDVNADGTSNMVWSKTWGRFNNCFISSGTSSYCQALTRLRSKDLVKNESFKKGLIDEVAYKSALLAMLNNGDAWKDNEGRYFWDNHCKFLNLITQGAFKDKVPGQWKWGSYSLQKVIEVLKSNYQPIVGIWIRDYWKTGKGHVTNAVGWQEEQESKRLTGLFFNDPAGNLIKKGSYKNALPTDGREVFYPVEIFPKIFPSQQPRHMLYFEEN
jgi:hypothetical protein